MDEPRQERAWNSSCCCPACSFTVPPEVVWLRRPNSWNVLHNLLQVSGTVCWRRVRGGEEGSDLARRKRRREQDELVKRAARAEKLGHLGELSAARQALEGEAVAPGALRTQAALMDPDRRLPIPREPLPEDLNLFELDFDRFARNIRSAKKRCGRGA